MKRSIRQIARGAVVLALVLTNAELNWAQEASPVPIAVPTERPRTRLARSEAIPGDTIRFDLDFPGGTVVEFVELVSKARGTLVNVVIPEDLRLVMIPEMKMTQVNASSLLQAASTALARTRRVAISGTAGSAFFDRQSVGYNFQPIAEGVWTFMAVGDSSDEIPVAQSVVFFSLEPYLGQYSVDDIITVIEAGNQLRPGSKPLSLKFHKETKLLVVRGTAEDLDLVKGALAQLPQGEKPNAPVPPAPPAAPQPK